MHTRASNSELVEPLLEPERTLNRRRRRRNRRVPFDQRNNPPKNPRIVYPPILDINHFRHFLVTLENLYPMDDEPMWAADRVVAPTPGSAITIPETANEFAIKDELNEGTIKTWDKLRTAFISRFFPPSLFDRVLREIHAFSQHENKSLTEAWLRMKEMLRNCHGHNLSKGNIIKIFYHGHNKITQEVINAASSVIFLYKTPNQAYQLLEDKVLLKLDWAKNQKTKSSLKKTVAFVAEGNSNSDTDKIMARMDAMTMKMDAHNTQPNLKGSSSKPYQPPQARNEHVNAISTRSGKSYDPPVNPNDQQNDSETHINFDSDDEDDEPTPQPKPKNPKPVKETPTPKPYKPKVPYPQCLRKKIEAQYGKFLDMIRAVRINVPLVDVLAGMPNYGKFLKELQLNLGVRTERMIFNIDSAIKHSYSNDDTCFSIDVIDEILEEDFNALLDEGSEILHSLEGTILEEKLFAEFDEFMAMTADENSKSESDIEEPPFEKYTFNTD
ncbi:reverse transcriptase domain-containing protein [Tanacetum coccineum]|uniref:Reverse transcriptase domain-containing protein n=1 Tax=Tanacetum coccineum TaxID=301880 RepID=A0ABQ5BGM4_9ASTR